MVAYIWFNCLPEAGCFQLKPTLRSQPTVYVTAVAAEADKKWKVLCCACLMHNIVQSQLLLGSSRGKQHAGARKMTEKEKGKSINIKFNGT